jgi:hypothetical protein
MKYVVYILTAVLAVAAVVMLVQLIAFVSTAPDNMTAAEFGSGLWFDIVLMGAVAVVAVVQLFKSTPRLMLLFAGAVMCDGISLLVGQWIPSMLMLAASQSLQQGVGLSVLRLTLAQSLLMMAAGLLPALYEWIRHGLLVKAQPKRSVKRGLVVAAAVLACVNLALSLVQMASQVSVMMSYDMPLMYVLPSHIIGVLFAAGLVVACFMIRRRTGSLYRMFFAGPIVLSTIVLPLNVVSQLQMGMDATAVTARLIFLLPSIVAAVFVLVHAAKHRHEDFAPPTPPLSDEPASAVAA